MHKADDEATEFKISAASRIDAEGMAQVHVDTWRTTYKGIVPDAHLESLSYEKRSALWSQVIAEQRPRYHVWVVKNKSDAVIGFSDGGENRDRSLPFDGEIYAIYLRKEFQGLGVGKRLFLDSFEQLYRHGFTSALVWVLEDNPTRKFYEAMGGEIAGRKWIEIGGKRLQEIAYGWEDLRAVLQKFRPELRHSST